MQLSLLSSLGYYLIYLFKMYISVYFFFCGLLLLFVCASRLASKGEFQNKVKKRKEKPENCEKVVLHFPDEGARNSIVMIRVQECLDEYGVFSDVYQKGIG
jgi:hypothetical protein